MEEEMQLESKAESKPKKEKKVVRPKGAVVWSKIKLSCPSSAELEAALYAVGIITPDDMHKNPNVAIGVLQKLYKVDLGKLFALATEAKSKGR